MRLLHRLKSHHVVSNFKGNQRVSKEAFGSDGLVGPELHLEKVKHVPQMLVSLLVVDGVDHRVLPVLSGSHVMLLNKLLPDRNNLSKVSLRTVVLGLALFAENLAHVVIAGAHSV
jgi:hypothetical protein